MIRNRYGLEKTVEEVFVENSTLTRHRVKSKILKYDLLPYICFECDLADEWNGQLLVLQPDHINGNNRDNRILNLRFLCPNCHSQSETYCGRNNATVF